MKLPEAQKWKAASDKEIKSLQNLEDVSAVPRSSVVPPVKNVIGSRWVYEVKSKGTHKGRLVAQGWNQVPDRDCGRTYAPVCRFQSIRMVLPISPEMDWEIFQLDVQTSFLHADVEKGVRL